MPDVAAGRPAHPAADDAAVLAGHVVETVEMHTGGEPVRILAGGLPAPQGDTLLAKRRDARDRLDAFRRALMGEPRGHADMYGVWPVTPDHPDADLAVLFLHNEGYSTMCGHATIAFARHAVESHLVEVHEPVTRLVLQVPCGLVDVEVDVDAGRVGDVRFTSVPSFAAALDVSVEVAGVGPVMLDVGYGGAFYALVPDAALGLDLSVSPLEDLVRAATAVTQAVSAAVPLDHPDADDLAFLYGTIITDHPESTPRDVSVNVCVFADRQVDRSPTGSGVSARLAVQHARGVAPVGTVRRFASLTAARFGGRVVAPTRVGALDAVRIEVSGRAHHVGTARFVFEADDPLVGGFLLA
jgi:proline racemase